MNVITSMKRHIILFCFLTVGFNLYSESVFTYDLKKDIVISALSALSLGIFSVSYFVDDQYGIPNNLNRKDVNIFDRGLMFPNNKTLITIRNIVRYPVPLLPIIVPLAGDIRNDFDVWLTYGIMYTQAMAFAGGTIEVMKRAVDRYRPRSYFEDTIAYPVDNDCFPSDTTNFAFLTTTFLSVTFSAEYPDSPLKIPVIVGSSVLSASIGVMSILSGMHFLTDVLAAAIIGSFYGWAIPALHRRTNNENRISFSFTGNGGLISLKF